MSQKQKKLNLNIGKLRFQTRNFPFPNLLVNLKIFYLITN